MLKEYEKFRLSDKNRQNDLFAEVNWKDDKAIDECKIVKFTLGDKVAYVPKNLLFSMIWTMGTPDEQAKSIPQKIKKVRWYETVVGVKVKRDIAKNETINFPIKLSLPSVEEEVISELSKSLKVPKNVIEKVKQ